MWTRDLESKSGYVNVERPTFGGAGMCDYSDADHLCPGLGNVDRAQFWRIPTWDARELVQEALAARPPRSRSLAWEEVDEEHGSVIAPWVASRCLTGKPGSHATPQLMQTIEPTT